MAQEVSGVLRVGLPDSRMLKRLLTTPDDRLDRVQVAGDALAQVLAATLRHQDIVLDTDADADANSGKTTCE